LKDIDRDSLDRFIANNQSDLLEKRLTVEITDEKLADFLKEREE